MKHDVVYFVKNTDHNEELRYSLRSVEKNFPHNKVWFFGGCPKDLKPDVFVPVKQDKGSKYQNVRGSVFEALHTEGLSDDFYLFNDDFFVMSKVSYVVPAVNGSIAFLIQKLNSKYPENIKAGYRNRLKNTVNALRKANKDRLNYELHIPMLINKQKGIDILNIFDNTVAFRSTYGNYYGIAKTIHPDVKIFDIDKTYDPDIHNVFLSTSDFSWNHGLIGEYIRSQFPDPSRFEI